MAQTIAHYKETLHLAIPVMVVQAGQMLVQVVDSVIAGRLGTNELAASSFAHNLFSIGLIFAIGFTGALTPLVGESAGNGDVARIGYWLKNAIRTNTLFVLVLCIVMTIVGFCMPYMGQPSAVVALAQPYYFVFVASMPFFLVFYTGKQFAEGLSNTKAAMRITVWTNILNVGLSYSLSHGLFGLPAMGVLGIAVGSLMARGSAGILLWMSLWRDERLHNVIHHIGEAVPDRAGMQRLITLGIPIAAQHLTEVTAFAVGAIMMGWLGAEVLAAHQIAIGLASLTFMMCAGVGAAVTIRVSTLRGREKYAEIYPAGQAAFLIVLLVMTITACGFVVGRDVLGLLYSSDHLVLAQVSGLFIVAAVFQVFDGQQVAALGALKGLADVRMPTIITFVAYLCIAIPTSYVLGFVLHWGGIGVWLGYVAGLAVSAVLLTLRFMMLTKYPEKKRTMSYTE
jgi:MATE family multidrug resistance protein